ncbi:MAG: polysaccharide biosynthesis tyrosine autokinase [Pseudobdellovibrionaceae bacterium]|nr:polysaccharide biosynthesis tyrosine autokinase [Bdellovibrionales bacterium]USN48421.1 MAG: polysaccharide biosynthesis tyrosine autokinase [Pseudobdellovibrionaceae bacterium]
MEKEHHKPDRENERKKVTLRDDEHQRKRMGFSEFFNIVRLQRKYIYLMVAITTLGTLIGHLLNLPEFKAQATLVVEPPKGPQVVDIMNLQRMGAPSASERIDSYLHHLQSDTFLYNIAHQLKFDTSFEKINLIAPKDVSLLKRKYWGHFITHVIHKNVKLPWDQSQEKIYVPVEAIVSYLKSVVEYETDFNNLIFIKVTTLDSYTSQKIANTIAEDIVQSSQERSSGEITRLEEYLTQKISDTTARLKKSELDLVQFKKKHNIISSTQQADGLAALLHQNETQLKGARLQIEENNKLIDYFRKERKNYLSKLASSGSQATSLTAGAHIPLLEKKIGDLKRERDLMIQQEYKEDHWRIVEIDKEIDRHSEELGRTMREAQRSGSGANSLAASEQTDVDPEEALLKIKDFKEKNRELEARISTLKTELGHTRRRIETLPRLEQEYMQLDQAVQLEYSIFTELKKKLSDLEIQRASQVGDIRAEQMASLPGATPQKSLIVKLIFSVLLGVFFGTAVITAIELLDPSVKSRDDVEDCGFHYMGEVPYMSKTDIVGHRHVKVGSPNLLVCNNRPESLEAMAFKYIRAQLESIVKHGNAAKVFTISSPNQGEGKSFVCSNLAVCISQLGKKTLLIDCDLRQPAVGPYFDLTAHLGVADLLKFNTPINEILVSNVFPNLDVITAGFDLSKSTELLSSDKFRLLIEHFRGQYDYIVLDGPPANAVVDSAILASISDFGLMVSSYRKTTKKQLVDAHNKILQLAYKRIYGIVNNVKASEYIVPYYVRPYHRGYHDQGPTNNGHRPGADPELADFLSNIKNSKTG